MASDSSSRVASEPGDLVQDAAGTGRAAVRVRGSGSGGPASSGNDDADPCDQGNVKRVPAPIGDRGCDATALHAHAHDPQSSACQPHSHPQLQLSARTGQRDGGAEVRVVEKHAAANADTKPNANKADADASVGAAASAEFVGAEAINYIERGNSPSLINHRIPG